MKRCFSRKSSILIALRPLTESFFARYFQFIFHVQLMYIHEIFQETVPWNAVTFFVRNCRELPTQRTGVPFHTSFLFAVLVTESMAAVRDSWVDVERDSWIFDVTHWSSMRTFLLPWNEGESPSVIYRISARLPLAETNGNL